MDSRSASTPVPDGAACRTRPPTVPPLTVDEHGCEVLAGYIVWLARQDVPAARRVGYHREVERYLKWRLLCADATAAGFLSHRRDLGDDEQRRMLVEVSLRLLARYLLAASSRARSSNPLWSQLPREIAER